MALLVGLDVGSTTTKVYAMHEDMTEAWWGYRRHGACQTASVRAMLGELAERFPHESLRVAVTGSGARDIATALGASYVQEVVANALAISRFYPQTRCAIELGGQDAKMIFFRTNDKGDIEVADMRMNGSCAGGTGAFIDEMAKLMGGRHRIGRVRAARKPGERLSTRSRAAAACTQRPISSRCSTRGIPTTDLALSALHAVARQTIGGLAQGYRHRAAGNLRGRYARLQPHAGPRVPGATESIGRSGYRPARSADHGRARCRPVADRHVRIVPTDRPSRRFCPAG